MPKNDYDQLYIQYPEGTSEPVSVFRTKFLNERTLLGDPLVPKEYSYTLPKGSLLKKNNNAETLPLEKIIVEGYLTMYTSLHAEYFQADKIDIIMQAIFEKKVFRFDNDANEIKCQDPKETLEVGQNMWGRLTLIKKKIRKNDNADS